MSNRKQAILNINMSIMACFVGIYLGLSVEFFLSCFTKSSKLEAIANPGSLTGAPTCAKKLP